jgi:hypothetical protein
VQDATTNAEIGDPQPEIEVGGDTSLFTRTTDPHNPWRIAEILKHVTIGPNLSEEQQNKARDLITEFTDCFALSVHEVLPIPCAEHHIHIPAGVTFPKKIPHQQPLTEAQHAYLSDATDELLAAGIIEPIQPEDVKCASPLMLTQKVHSKAGLSLHELQHRVNEECIMNSFSPAHNIKAPNNVSLNTPKTETTKMA